ncbi:hypothetical protein [Actinoplanes sp. G11-F43]|uniref:hypothetical protein n=1 Tax=Actinoplanes sp. G11-F43 TaxID=3424130 RepID=UPI003D34449D
MPPLDELQELDDIKMYGALCAVRLARVGSLGGFIYQESFDRYVEGVFDPGQRSGTDLGYLLQAADFETNDEAERVKFYQNKAIRLALRVGGDLDDPRGPRR